LSHIPRPLLVPQREVSLSGGFAPVSRRSDIWALPTIVQKARTRLLTDREAVALRRYFHVNAVVPAAFGTFALSAAPAALHGGEGRELGAGQTTGSGSLKLRGRAH
jgi:hypothetical protein